MSEGPCWKEKVYPHFGAAAMDQSMTNMNAYLAHYFEAGAFTRPRFSST
jgi:hypothetical protein